MRLVTIPTRTNNAVCNAIEANQAKIGRFAWSGQSDAGQSDTEGLVIGLGTGLSGRNIKMASGKKTTL